MKQIVEHNPDDTATNDHADDGNDDEQDRNSVFHFELSFIVWMNLTLIIILRIDIMSIVFSKKFEYFKYFNTPISVS